MKKIIAIFILIFTIFQGTYAETLISGPNIGYRRTLSFKPETANNIVDGIYGMHIGANVGYLAKNSFTFLFNCGLTISPTMTKEYGRGFGIGSQAQFLFGYTFRLNDDKLHLMVGSGIGGELPSSTVIALPSNGGGMVPSFPVFAFTIDIPVHLSLDYYFNNRYGINFTINDSFGIMPGHWLMHHTMTLTVCPKFKLYA